MGASRRRANPLSQYRQKTKSRAWDCPCAASPVTCGYQSTGTGRQAGKAEGGVGHRIDPILELQRGERRQGLCAREVHAKLYLLHRPDSEVPLRRSQEDPLRQAALSGCAGVSYGVATNARELAVGLRSAETRFRTQQAGVPRGNPAFREALCSSVWPRGALRESQADSRITPPLRVTPRSLPVRYHQLRVIVAVAVLRAGQVEHALWA